MTAYETVIGLEVHVELSTKSKIFCGCSTEFGAPPNTAYLSHLSGASRRPAGVEPTGGGIGHESGYGAELPHRRVQQIRPEKLFLSGLAQGVSGLSVRSADRERRLDRNRRGRERKRIGITRVHLEEDAGKLIHSENGDSSLVDYNRVGVPLIEIVSEPDLRSPAEARAYLEKLKAIMQYCEVSDVKMEEGSLRCDANISLRPAGNAILRNEDGAEEPEFFPQCGAGLGI